MGEAAKPALPIFGCEHARCDECSLKIQRDRGLYVPSRPPLEAFNGLMIVGEGPGRDEVTKGMPFVGECGRLLDGLLATAEISREATMITNATLCVTGSAQVRLADGSRMRLAEMVERRHPGPVLSLDASGCLVSRRVTGWFANQRGDRRLFKLTTEHAKQNSRGTTGPCVTEDHLVCTESGWTQAKDLRSGERIATGTVAPGLRAQQLIAGMLLGDGFLSRESNLRVSHARDQWSWLAAKVRLLNLPGRWNEESRVAKGWQDARMWESCALPFFRELHTLWWRPGLPAEFSLHPLTLAAWYFDDGSLIERQGRRPYASITCTSLPQADRKRLVSLLAELGIASSVVSENSYPKINLTVDGTDRLGSLLASYATPDVAYKLPEQYRDQYDARIYDPDPTIAYYDRVVVSEVSTRGRRTVYCLSVEETENFVASGLVVHNCQPPFVKKGEDDERRKQGFHNRHPLAVPSCLSRLEAEIAYYRPRVIVAFGTAALIAAIGYTKTKVRQVDNPCVRCSNTRKVGPAIACATGECGWRHFFDAPTHEAAKPLHEALLAELRDPAWNGKGKPKSLCPKCQSNIAKLKIREVKCPECDGKKKKFEEYLEFDYDYTITDVAGTILEAHKLSSRWDEFGVKYVIPTFHPSFCLREIDESETRKYIAGQYAAQAVVDHLIKARKLLTRDFHFDFSVVMTDSADDVREYTAEPGLYTIDIETNAKSPWDVTEIRCIGIGRSDREEVLVVDTQRLVTQRGNDETHEFEVNDHELLGALEDFLTAAGKPKCGQNLPYDYIAMRRLWGIDTAPIGGDTKNLHHVLRPDEPHNLQAIASELTEAPHWKPPKAKGEYKDVENFNELAIYNARDIRATALCHEVGAGQFELGVRDMPTGVQMPTYTKGGRISAPLSEYGPYNLRDVYDVDVNVIPIALEMEFFGLPMDIDRMRAMADEKVPLEAQLHAELCEMVRDRSGIQEFNPNSTPQLQWALYHPTGPFKLVAAARTDTGQPSTAKEDLAKINDHPFVQKLLRWKDVSAELRVLGGEGMIIREDGCVHPSWNTTGARTGRWSSSPNFQNIAEDLRAIVRAPKGWKIIGADESQLELRIMAALSGDPELIRRCRDADENKKSDPDFDPHAFVASVVFGAAFFDAPKEVRKQLRDLCKHVIYGMNYGAGAAKVRETIYKKGYKGKPISVEQVKHIIQTIFQLFTGIPTWREETLARSEANWQVRSPLLHRWRYFPLGKVEATVAWNYPIQSLAADLLNLRIIALKQRLVRERIPHRFMAQVHDAIYILAPEEYADRVAICMNEELSLPLSFNGGPEMPFAATAKIADDWSMKDAA